MYALTGKRWMFYRGCPDPRIYNYTDVNSCALASINTTFRCWTDWSSFEILMHAQLYKNAIMCIFWQLFLPINVRHTCFTIHRNTTIVNLNSFFNATVLPCFYWTIYITCTQQQRTNPIYFPFDMAYLLISKRVHPENGYLFFPPFKHTWIHRTAVNAVWPWAHVIHLHLLFVNDMKNADFAVDVHMTCGFWQEWAIARVKNAVVVSWVGFKGEDIASMGTRANSQCENEVWLWQLVFQMSVR